MKEEKLSIIRDDEETLATILFTYNNDDKNYVVFEFDDTKEISAAIYEENDNDEGILVDIETDEEWDMIDKVLDKYFDELEAELDEEEFDEE
ncbi:conserved hypothetical protein (DUF1292) [Alteracholeplasma palmae J233]|uniref:Uncharacterized protein n=1 Tax=Alteracholeplasma palmae (strain ATCC 49389 / J233) TaxID=1318466 RepID=U4KPR1_ALTPJ|nr:DUF1292 domain-containing protein [Alteracholeplasma palmae]CCV64270.1 conserved hypothetical protein (DUF1292) [Alteracholeplasma palmae J233]